ncbi:hypothetical protein HHK36_022009 [Tetracentron sinense]|uniref:PGG domain-containing protein n=1 Tax=Tetracentron sinense TaxID=13715 RepID=A0A834YP88_TETSI|nr:hypothetical protein HHK36_022009 [Tetracentron sinense]
MATSNKMRNDQYESTVHLFETMSRQTSVSWNATISVYLSNARFDLARQLFDRMPERVLVSWNVMISGRVGYVEKEEHMLKFHIEKLAVAFGILIVPSDETDTGDQESTGNNTVLHVTLRYRHSEVVKVLTEKAPELWCVVNEVGESPLYLAAKGGQTEILGQVLQSSQPYAHDWPKGLTALHAAALWNNYGIAELVVKKKPELIKEQDIYGRTALHYAASYHKYNEECEVVKLLLEWDSSVAYIQDKDGRSALHFAAGKGDDGVTEEITRCYPDAVDLVDNRGQNAFHYCMNGCHLKSSPLAYYYIKVLHCLMSKVRDDEVLNQQDNDGNTPLHLAVINCIPDLVRCMLQKKGRVETDTMNKANFTPKDLTIPNKHRLEEEVAVYLELNKADTKFAFQVPGGYQSDDGTATLAKKAAFQVFVVMDAIALSCSMTAVFLNFIFTIFLLYNSYSDISKKFILFVTFLVLMAMIAMLIAFVAGLNDDSSSFADDQLYIFCVFGEDLSLLKEIYFSSSRVNDPFFFTSPPATKVFCKSYFGNNARPRPSTLFGFGIWGFLVFLVTKQTLSSLHGRALPFSLKTKTRSRNQQREKKKNQIEAFQFVTVGLETTYALDFLWVLRFPATTISFLPATTKVSFFSSQ